MEHYYTCSYCNRNIFEDSTCDCEEGGGQEKSTKKIYYCETGTTGFKPTFGYRCQEHLTSCDHVLQELPQLPEFEPDECDICAQEARDPGRIPARVPQVDPLEPCMGCGQLLPASEMVPTQAPEGSSGLICAECKEADEEAAEARREAWTRRLWLEETGQARREADQEAAEARREAWTRRVCPCNRE